MGVFPRPATPATSAWGLPHPRGGVSYPQQHVFSLIESSPPAWGCFSSIFRQCVQMFVFPTRVGVFPTAEDEVILKNGLPHPRGGVSPAGQRYGTRLRSSPPAWGCFHQEIRDHAGQEVFPTRVGVFPEAHAVCGDTSGLPHPRGGVSGVKVIGSYNLPSSPPLWGILTIPSSSSLDARCILQSKLEVFMQKASLYSITLPFSADSCLRRLSPS